MSRPRRILVVTSGALFVRGGHLTIAEEILKTKIEFPTAQEKMSAIV